MTFKVGDRVRTVKRGDFSWWSQGWEAVVSKVSTDHYKPYTIDFAPRVSAHGGSFGVVGADQIVLLEAPSIAKDLKLTPQAKTVLRHLNAGKSISPMNALMVYGISRLASCIYEIRRAGYVVTMIQKRDEQGHKYARYSLA